MAKETPNDATLAVRAKYSQALMRMQELANSSVTNPRRFISARLLMLRLLKQH
jgi:hypothetical protein